VTAADVEELGDAPWTTFAPSSLAHSSEHAAPTELDHAGIHRATSAVADAARRALAASFEIRSSIALTAICSISLSPIANKRTDAYGGSREDRMRFSPWLPSTLYEMSGRLKTRFSCGSRQPIICRMAGHYMIRLRSHWS